MKQAPGHPLLRGPVDGAGHCRLHGIGPMARSDPEAQSSTTSLHCRLVRREAFRQRSSTSRTGHKKRKRICCGESRQQKRRFVVQIGLSSLPPARAGDSGPAARMKVCTHTPYHTTCFSWQLTCLPHRGEISAFWAERRSGAQPRKRTVFRASAREKKVVHL